MTNARDKANNPQLNFTSKGIDDNADATAITIDSSERVGIGTASPHSEMHIVADNVSETWSAYDGTALTVENNDNDGCIIQNIARNSATGEIWFGDDDGRNLGRIRYEHSGNALEFWTNGGEKLHINSSGQVGIGTSSPSPVSYTHLTLPTNREV